jgi:hypothetical protein
MREGCSKAAALHDLRLQAQKVLNIYVALHGRLNASRIGDFENQEKE